MMNYFIVISLAFFCLQYIFCLIICTNCSKLEEKPFKYTGIYTKSQAAKVVGSPYFVSDGRTYYVGVPGPHGCSGVRTTDIKFCPKCKAYMNHGTSNGSTTTIYCSECDYKETSCDH